MMIMETERLIRTLIDTATPVRPLPRPWVRCALWLAIAIPYMALVVSVMSPRADLTVKLTEARFLIEQFAALATGIAAAIAAFASTIPGYSRKVLFLPLLPLAAWLGAMDRAVSVFGFSSARTASRCSPTGSAFPLFYSLARSRR
jgi:hypothetical protein